MEFSYDTKYLQNLGRSDRDAEELLVALFKRQVQLNLRVHLRSCPQLIEDASQEVFLRVFAYFHAGKTLDNPSKLPAFIHSVCRNVALEMYRAHTRQPQLPEDAPECADPRIPEHAVILNQQGELIQKVLSELSERDRELLRRLLLNEEDKDRVCREFAIQRSYLRVLLHRARARFKTVLMRESTNGSSPNWPVQLTGAYARQ